MTMTTTRILRVSATTFAIVAGCKSDTPPETADGTGSAGITMTAGSVSDTEASTGTDASTGTTATTTDATGSTSGTVDPDTSAGSTEPTATESSSSGASSDPTDSSGGSSTTEAILPCDVAMAELEPVPPNVMLVLDKSGSMVDNSWDHDANGGTPDITRWNSLYQVVDFVTTTFDDQINFGAVLFPAVNATATYNASACVMGGAPDIGVSPNNSAAILAGIPAANELMIDGGTPATAGVTVGRDHLLDQNAANPRAIILVTDGAANCASDAANNTERFEVYDEQLPIVVGSTWTDDGVPVYVVGIDVADQFSDAATDGYPNNTNTYDALNEVAVAGGQPLPGAEQFYQTTNQLELQDALEQIVAQALSCTVPLDPEPPFPDLLEVVVADMDVPAVMDCATEDGWVYTNPGGPYDSIELCGTWCDALKDAGSVTANYFCDAG
jgi:hypothetical protein